MRGRQQGRSAARRRVRQRRGLDNWKGFVSCRGEDQEKRFKHSRLMNTWGGNKSSRKAEGGTSKFWIRGGKTEPRGGRRHSLGRSTGGN